MKSAVISFLLTSNIEIFKSELRLYLLFLILILISRKNLKEYDFFLKTKNRLSVTDVSLSLTRYGDTSVIDNFQEIISSGSPGEQVELLRVLPHYYSKHDDRITQILAIALKDKKTAIQAEAVRTIGEMEMEHNALFIFWIS
jgi:hypothetical protein